MPSEGDEHQTAEVEGTHLLNPSEYTIIHEVTEGQESLECQLESALDDQLCLIVIEPAGIGDHVIRWIRVGNFFHKSSVLADLSCLAMLSFVPRRLVLFTALPLGVFGVGCACFYNFSWRTDPCCKYQVDYKGTSLAQISSHELRTPNPVVLVKRNDKYRKILHNTLATVVFGIFAWRLYKHLYSC